MRYDCVIPLGQWCVTAEWLDNFGQRKCSLPFDWFMAHHVRVGAYVDILLNKFCDFMRPENLEPVPGEEGHYYDRGTGMTSLHDFVQGVSFEEALPTVRAKLGRRIDRCLDILRQARHVLLVQCVQQGCVDDVDMRDALNRLRLQYPMTTFDLTVLQHDEGATGIMCDAPGEGIRVYRGRFFGKDGDFVMGSRKPCQAVFGRIHVKGQWLNRIRNRLRGRHHGF